MRWRLFPYHIEMRIEMKKIVIGMLAHVDAGKTTLSEGLLYESGSIRKIGRVDNQDAFLDTYKLERDRGITIFSKQAIINFNSLEITLLDTPGHVDFSAEMERTLQVMDYAILVISSLDGVQAHTHTLWQLFEKYKIPVFIFVNKMDQTGTDKAWILQELRKKLDGGCIDFSEQNTESFYENIAMSHEAALDSFLDTGAVTLNQIQQLIQNRLVFPCFFGSALKLIGVNELLKGIERYICIPQYTAEFGGRVFKIARDDQGNRLTYLKVTGGILKVKMTMESNGQSEKINQIRIYSGAKFESVSEADAGTICAVTGLEHTYPGEGIGKEAEGEDPLLIPVLRYRLQLPEGCNPVVMMSKLHQLEEEDPALRLIWKEELQEIQCQIMGEIQIEILKSLIQDRFGVAVEFDAGTIVYRETIIDTVIGVGHFEPLRHYAEVQLLLEPGKQGSGLEFANKCSVDLLGKNWQRLILTHLKEREHKGVLIGAPITDIKITLLAGRSHPKHTEGGDFRQATYRAVRQGLKQASSILLEPFYKCRLEMPEKMVGRAMMDLKEMGGDFEPPKCIDGLAILEGLVPVATMRHYQTDFLGYTKGEGKLSLQIIGYRPCHNSTEIIEETAYNSDQDMQHPTSSVFCSHGTGQIVSWDQVKDYQQIENQVDLIQNTIHSETILSSASLNRTTQGSIGEKQWINEEEVNQILARTSHANSQAKQTRNRKYAVRADKESIPAMWNHEISKSSVSKEEKEMYLLVDGYNIIYAWDELKDLAMINMDSARGKLLDMLCNYQAVLNCQLIVVFDAYRIEGHQTEITDYHNIHVVFTKEAETADQYIEKFAHQNKKQYSVTVATSDGLEQIVIRSQGCHVISARDFLQEIQRINRESHEIYREGQSLDRHYLLEGFTDLQVNKGENE